MQAYNVFHYYVYYIVHVAIVKPFSELQCSSLSSFTLHYQWTEHVRVTSYNVSYHCSRTGKEVNEVITSPPTERIFEAEQDCLYTITMRAEGHDGYLLNCYTSTPSKLRCFIIVAVNYRCLLHFQSGSSSS